ncbi:hypothetical protein [Massilia sp. ST3]|uniref:hypothetical protein n=1 Tax=Massilia sp. ST3 TaxID=2824903 RepID=UPI001B814685|nr:hypothetical protein [Massilia sp. ST3]MBQ5948060.1 hypothetical protein [Massilia sp. ST3]
MSTNFTTSAGDQYFTLLYYIFSMHKLRYYKDISQFLNFWKMPVIRMPEQSPQSRAGAGHSSPRALRGEDLPRGRILPLFANWRARQPFIHQTNVELT